MGIADIFFLGASLAMDAASVAMADEMAYPRSPRKKKIGILFCFSMMQTAMTFFGYEVGNLFSDYALRYSQYIVPGIFFFLGLRMIGETFRLGKEVKPHASLTWAEIITQGIATSVDAFLVGIGLAGMCRTITVEALVIGFVTAVLVLAAMVVGKKFGKILGDMGQIAGGLILILLGLKGAGIISCVI